MSLPHSGGFSYGQICFQNMERLGLGGFWKAELSRKLGLQLAFNERGEATRRIHALDTSERTIAEALREAGYYTAILGKWHLGEWLPEHLPMGQGFDYQYGHYAWGIDYYNKTIVHNAPARFAVYDWHRNQIPIDETGYATDLIAEEAVELITSSKENEQPFFLYVAFNAVHGPLNPPPGFEGDTNDPLAIRDAMLQNLDQAVGKIDAAINDSGLRDNTLFIFTNDNGPVLEEMSHPYRGTKNTTFEGGVRQPAILR